jgi:type IV secretory pathway VirB10-like protein
MKKKEDPDVYALAPEPEVKKVGPRAAILALIALCLVMAAMSHFTNRQLKQAEQQEPPIVTPPPIDPEKLRQAAETSQRLRELRAAIAEREAAKQAVTAMPQEWFHPPARHRPTPAAQRVSRSLHPAGFSTHAETLRPVPSRESPRAAARESESTQVLRDWTRELHALGEPAAAAPVSPRPAPRYEPQRAERHPPPGRYVLRAGTSLDAVLQSHVHSEVPGQVVAQVSGDVYDSRSGRYLLIPAGSLLLGRLDRSAVFGEQRVQIAWERLQYPGGRTVVLAGLPTADGSGAAGVSDRVDNHWGRLYGHAFLTSLVGAAGQLSQPQRSAVGFQAPSFGQEAAGAIGRDLAQVTERVLERNLQVRPTLEIRPGFLLHVVLTEDYFFESPWGVSRQN